VIRNVHRLYIYCTLLQEQLFLYVICSLFFCSSRFAFDSSICKLLEAVACPKPKLCVLCMKDGEESSQSHSEGYEALGRTDIVANKLFVLLFKMAPIHVSCLFYLSPLLFTCLPSSQVPQIGSVNCRFALTSQHDDRSSGFCHFLRVQPRFLSSGGAPSSSRPALFVHPCL
jgi:hypothetical protein